MKKFMIVNKESAMRIWTNSIGKKTKAFDFSGREIHRGAYNDRNSKYGWNIDHIKPESRGGKTADHNLICCNISTNDEKADKFPCFTANGKKYEIIKVQNHYEIKPLSSSTNKVEKQNNNSINFFDVAAGVRFINKKVNDYSAPIFTATINIQLTEVHNHAIFDLINEIFQGLNINVTKNYNHYLLTITKLNCKQQSKTQDLLNNCVLLNTYLTGYFLENGFVSSYKIGYNICDYESTEDRVESNYDNYVIDNSLCINGLVKSNTDIKDLDLRMIQAFQDDEYSFYEYNYHYTKLLENLRKVNVE